MKRIVYTLILYPVSLFSTAITHDPQALYYCNEHTDTYLMVVWPRGYAHLNLILERLRSAVTVNYIKRFTLGEGAPFALFRYLHKAMSYQEAYDFFAHYLPSRSRAPYHCAAILFQTDKPLSWVQALKYGIRIPIGVGYRSLHVTDYYHETRDAARLIFNDKKLSRL